jgi:hypothetical protein
MAEAGDTDRASLARRLNLTMPRTGRNQHRCAGKQQAENGEDSPNAATNITTAAQSECALMNSSSGSATSTMHSAVTSGSGSPR